MSAHTMFATSTQARYAERQRERGLATQARDRKPELQRAVDSAIHGLEVLSRCDPDKDRMLDLIGGLIDTANLIDAQLRLDLENAGEHWSAVDLAECHALWNRVHP